jgi:hypothetical protein
VDQAVAVPEANALAPMQPLVVPVWRQPMPVSTAGWLQQLLALVLGVGLGHSAAVPRAAQLKW